MNSLRMLVLAGAVAVVGGCSGQPSVVGKWEGTVNGGELAFVLMEDGQAQFLIGGILQKKERQRAVRWAVSSDKPADGYTGVLDMTLSRNGQEQIVKASYKLEGDALTLVLYGSEMVLKRIESKPTMEPDMSSIIGGWKWEDDEGFYIEFNDDGNLKYPGHPEGTRWRAVADGRIRAFYVSNGEDITHDCVINMRDGWLYLNPAGCFGDASLPDKDIKLGGPF